MAEGGASVELFKGARPRSPSSRGDKPHGQAGVLSPAVLRLWVSDSLLGHSPTYRLLLADLAEPARCPPPVPPEAWSTPAGDMWLGPESSLAGGQRPQEASLAPAA